MSKLNRPTSRPAPRSPITTATASTGTTHQGGAGYARDVKSELFLLAVANFVSEDSFYEKGNERDSRYAQLVRQAAIEHPQWTADMLRWLRTEANMRTASIVGAVEFVMARLSIYAGKTSFTPAPDGLNRRVIASVLVRPDEPGEMVAYYKSTYGTVDSEGDSPTVKVKLPMPIKRGIADAIKTKYREWSVLKYDTASHGVRFADVLELTHARPTGPNQSALFKWLLDTRHHPQNAGLDAAKLPMLTMNADVRGTVVEGNGDDLLDELTVRRAGLTWEDVLSLGGQLKMDKRALWESVIPSMGYMALLRNLRNFDAAGVSDDVADTIKTKLATPAEVHASRQFPFRFLSAYNHAPSLRWSYALSKALDASLSNVPALAGRTLILIDTSGSMSYTMTRDGTMRLWEQAALFGIALGNRCEHKDVISYSVDSKRFPLIKGESTLRSLERFKHEYFYGNGTFTADAVKRWFAGHDRVIILTDEQHAGGVVDRPLPATTPLYTWNLAGYRMGHVAGTPNRHTFGGLTDAAFKMIPLLEAGRNGRWPWEVTTDGEGSVESGA